MPAKNIKLFEHNSSRLLFIDTQDPDFKLDLEELPQDSSEIDSCNCNRPKFLLGKLNNYIWFLEDSGEYDTNHTHQASITHTDQSDNIEQFFNVNRIMEYSEECDRLYTAHSGCTKIVLIDSPLEEQTIEMFIKYDRTLPGIERIGDLKNTNTGETYPACIIFYKYDSNNTLQIMQATQLIAGLDVIDSNTLQSMQNINYCSMTVKNASIDFNKLTINYSVDPNISNDIKISFIGTNSLFINPSLGNYGKFISKNYYENNENFIEPGVFIVQAPKNRSWICYRINFLYDPGTYIYSIPQSNLTTHSYDWTVKTKNNCYCCYINKASLNGYYGNLVNNKYVYEINIDRNEAWFSIMIPFMFTDYESLEYFDNNNNLVTNYEDLGANNFIEDNLYNELDGMFYKRIVIPIGLQYCKVYKVKLTYNKA